MVNNNKISTSTVTRNLNELAKPTGNIYETVAILSSRANQLTLQQKEELQKKLEEFREDKDSIDEEYENREQIEISKYYEKLPKPSLVSIYEFQNDKISYSYPKSKSENRE